ncbi:hypothetical protein J4573_12210 [Actinomadura barringtoniae]|uniref:WxL domain-containing protein n=1 Tax=Actinomadura barringtoniae TaxID=1427535 RepID=A0A939PD42_9ACTN|nr:WxL domain-containing protein [Actinomadura barringtoniae]MBO2447858.1 hypothetical protein [Actinomadura barringtoniae]
MARHQTDRPHAAVRGPAPVIVAVAAIAGTATIPFTTATAAQAAQAARAGTGTATYDCAIFSTHFDYEPTITVTAPADAAVGDQVPFEAEFTPMPNKAPLPVDKWTTTGQISLSGAATGEAGMSAPEKTGPVAPGTPITIGKLTGRFTAGNAGDVRLAPGKLVVSAVASGATAAITCALKGSAPTLATVKVAGATGPAATVTPSSIQQGAAITIGGTGWQSGNVSLSLCDANGAACKDGDLTDAAASADATGMLTGHATIADQAGIGARTLKVTQGAVSKDVALTVTEKSTPPTGGCAGKPADRCGEQKVSVTVNAGALTMSRQPGEVTLTPVTLDGTARTATGDLKQVQVVDARGGTSGWSLTGTITDFASSSGLKIPAGNLSWTPKCAAAAGSSVVTTGSAGPLDTTTASALCGAADGTGAVVGGSFTADAGLNLKVPPVTGAGQYAAVLTLTLS